MTFFLSSISNLHRLFSTVAMCNVLYMRILLTALLLDEKDLTTSCFPHTIFLLDLVRPETDRNKEKSDIDICMTEKGGIRKEARE